MEATKATKAGVTMAYILLGGAVGAAVGMLMAPQSGAETREQISSRLREGRESLGSGVKSAKDRLQRTSEKISSSTQQLITRGRTTFSREGRDAVAEAIDAAKRAYLEEKDAWMLKRQ
ncbi:MAG: YtxH domain-containing protein [Candidatus Abyssobacteria bacterium SURF_5]|uniref:YtxH domain-containing protein n=1 Tax=Abyssobacteria bacterium (strain SURF_5) TaxID=2093360 RepID=A0A3A4P6M6_ABYX5|nr:MAG: YtxH domain-containing protein [Candidatus Abyssubacteria bacterium SURF_5]